MVDLNLNGRLVIINLLFSSRSYSDRYIDESNKVYVFA